MNRYASDRREGRSGDRPDKTPRSRQEPEEELETGEPIPEEEHPQPAEKKIPGRKLYSSTQPPGDTQVPGAGSQTTPGGQMVLSTAKYLPKSAFEEPKSSRGSNRRGAEQCEEGGRSFEGKVMNSGVGGGMLAMFGASVWFVVGLANDYFYFYPPILFVLGLVSVLKGLSRED